MIDPGFRAIRILPVVVLLPLGNDEENARLSDVERHAHLIQLYLMMEITIYAAVSGAETVVAMGGSTGSTTYRERTKTVVDLIKSDLALTLTKVGHPYHPGSSVVRRHRISDVHDSIGPRSDLIR